MDRFKELLEKEDYDTLCEEYYNPVSYGGAPIYRPKPKDSEVEDKPSEHEKFNK